MMIPPVVVGKLILVFVYKFIIDLLPIKQKFLLVILYIP